MDSPPVKRIALIGSSGGGTATCGHTNPETFFQAISRHLGAIQLVDVQLSTIIFVSIDSGKGFDGSTGREAATLHLKRESSQKVFRDSLDRINQLVENFDNLLANDVNEGRIDGLICVSCKPSLFVETWKAVAANRVPVTGTGGSSLSEVSSRYDVDLVGNAGGSVATTQETKAISFAIAFAEKWTKKYDLFKANANQKLPTWRSVLTSCLPAFWSVCLFKRLMLKTPLSNFVPGGEMVVVSLESYALPIVCSVLMARSRHDTESTTMAAVLAATSCRRTVIGGLLAGWLVTILVEWVLWLCVLKWKLTATMTNLLSSGLVGVAVAVLLSLVTSYLRTASTQLRETISMIWDDYPIDTAEGVSRLLLRCSMGCLFCYGSKIGWYHSVYLPMILIEMELGDASILGTLDFLSLVLVCAGICLGLLLTGPDGDRALAMRGIRINLLCGDFVEACYPYMEQNVLVSMGGYFASAISSALLTNGCKSSAYLPFPLAIWVADDHSLLLIVSSVAFFIPFLVTVLNQLLSTQSEMYNFGASNVK